MIYGRSQTGTGKREPGCETCDATDLNGRWRELRMGKYILRRLVIALPSLLGISLILFVLLALAPGDPFGELATNSNIPPEVRAALRVKFGIDDPILVRYVRWLAAMLQGDWGFSFASRIDVDKLILQRVPTTLFVVGSSQILALAVALPVGV